MYEPIVRDGKLYGLSLNPLGEKEPELYPVCCGMWAPSNFDENLPMCCEQPVPSCESRQMHDDWQKAESQRRLVEVDEAEYKLKESHYAGVVESLTVEILSSSEYLTESKTFTADESNNKLINLKVI